MSERRCETCACWLWTDVGVGANNTGECRAHAPLGFPSFSANVKPQFAHNVDMWGRWPLTVATDWCGEHRPKPVAQTPEAT